ncbi:HNH endonuclease [Mucilaginibacter sp.]|jgi:putative restriction endonuclease|uniref:HNH endonuclease n=1 Tax=Mucilaginibacter sp. TaxID=1882438 RepID=UPI0035699F26
MKEGQSLWTKEELNLAINLYSKITFGQMHQRNSAIIDLANLIGRTPGSIAYKLVNFASLDPRLNQKGMVNASKLDKDVWQEYMQNWDDVFIEGEKLLAKKKDTTIEKLYDIDLDQYRQIEGRDAERKVKVRLDQSIFRGVVLTNFNNQCCITGINIVELIVASHIAPWSQDGHNRLNPQNGLALNALHDRAFDKHLITVTEELKIKISSKFYQHKHIESIKHNFIEYDGKEIITPKKFFPNVEFLKRHNEKFIP